MPDESKLDEDELSNADVIAIYTLYEAEVSKIWQELGADNPSTTMRDAVKEWKRRQETNAT
jgi:hypothetical protein